MSSIAYITDPKIIEYVRGSGSRELNFWRLSMRNFESFSEGSLLFFIDKRIENRHKKEKGIIGFGRATSFRKMSPQLMWKRYKSTNGYHDYISFLEAIKSAAKSEMVPKSIQSIGLDSIVFFKGPVFLSEIGVELPPNLESFTYLDKGNETITQKLIEKGMEIGVDTWYHAFNPNISESELENINREQIIRSVLASIDYPFTKQQANLLRNYKPMFNINSIGYDFIDGKHTIVLACTSSRQQQYGILGIIQQIKNDIPKEDLSFKIILRKGSQQPTIKLNPEIVLEYI